MRPIIELLSDYTGAEQEQRVRTNACVALGAVATSEAMEHLFRLGLNDASEEVRKCAAREIAQAPDRLRTPIIRRLYHGSEKGGEWRSNFELLQSIGTVAGKLEPRPGDWLRRVLQILILNFRIIATRGSEFSLRSRLKLGSMFIALLCSTFFITIWTLLAFGDQLDDDWTGLLAVTFLLWMPLVFYPIIVTMVPAGLRFSQNEASFADALWLLLIFTFTYLVVSALFGELETWGGKVLAEFLSLFLFFFVPIAAARICLGFARAPVPGMPYLLRCLATGLGGATVSVWIVMLATDWDRPFSDVASLSLLLALSTVFFLCWVRALQGAPPEARGADASDRKLLRALPALCLGLIALVSLFLVSVPRSEPIPLGREPSSLEREMSHGQRLTLVVTHPGEVEIVLAGEDVDSVLWLDGDRRDEGSESTPERLTRSIGRGSHTVRTTIYGGGSNRSGPKAFLRLLENRVGAWVSLANEIPGTNGESGSEPDQETMTLNLIWTPSTKSP